MKRYTVYTLDILGNESDGFEVNDSFNQGEIELSNDFNRDELLDRLDEIVGIDNRDEAKIDLESIEFIEVKDRDSGRPVFHLYEVTKQYSPKNHIVNGHCVILNGDAEKLVCDCSDPEFKTEAQAIEDAKRICALLNEAYKNG